MITMCSTIYIIAVLALSAVDTVNSSKLFGVSNLHRIQSFGDDHFNGRSCNDSNVKLRRKRRHQELDSSIKSHHVPIYESTHLQSILRAIRAGGDANNNSKSKASKSSPTRHISTKQSHRRGTRTTGAGASRRNPSIFSKQDEDEAAKSWTTAALAGDMLNRQSSEVEKAKNNPMVGRLWAKLSDQGTLILKLAPKSTNEQDVYVELSEWDVSNSTISSKLPNDSIPTRQSIHMTQLATVTDAKSDPFIPLEGIYGIYNLPCSGPHAILITESEEIYTSPVSTTKAPNSTPLLELRRIKSLEIVPLRGKTNSILAYQLSEEQLVEEARQLRLLRNSYKEHDFYFTVPRTLDIKQQSPVVQDVTHSLQRMFLDWSAESKIHGNAQNHWWTPYVAVKTQQTRHHTVDPRFFWNEQPALTLLRAATTSLDVNENSTTALFGRMLDTVIPVTSAFVGVERNIPVPNSDTSSTSNEAYDQVLISRRSKYRTGTRFTRRGADDTGAVANYAETEQICLITTKNTTDASNRQLSEIYSHVQTRGSIPLHWSSPADVKAYRPRVFIGVDPTTQARGLRDHLLGELWWYTSSIPIKSVESDDQQVKLAMVNLIDKHGDQGRLGTTFDSVLSAVLDVYDANIEDSTCIADEDTKQLLHPKSVKHVWYDFHAECKGGRWDKLSDLLDEVSPILSKQAYFCAIPTHQPTGSDQWKIASLQDGVVRTNCMDCLDRTNVVQSMFGRFMLYRMFHERLGLSVSRDKKPSRKRSLPLEYVVGFKQRPLCLPWDEGESAHRHLWADNADAISRLYAGTPYVHISSTILSIYHQHLTSFHIQCSQRRLHTNWCSNKTRSP